MQPHQTQPNSGNRAGDEESQAPHVVLVGPPNVGKSALFNALTGSYVVVSNYPGTTIEVTKGKIRLKDEVYRLTDTPGTYSLLPMGDDERVTRRLLLEGLPDVVVHVVDAKSLERMLPMSIQLRELGVSLVVVVNMMDEADSRGIKIDLPAIERWLGAPVVATAATSGRGVDELRAAIRRACADDREKSPPAARGLVLNSMGACSAQTPQSGAPCTTEGTDEIGELVASATANLAEGLTFMKERAPLFASLLLQGDEEIESLLPDEASEVIARAAAYRARITSMGEEPAISVMRRYHDIARAFVAEAVTGPPMRSGTMADRVHRLVVRPWTGVPILLLILYFGLYWFVGVFGAGIVVDFIEDSFFGSILIPWTEARLEAWLPGESGWRYWLRELFGGDYGIIPLALTYAIAIVLPIVALFFLFFSVLEDSGYFPRLALLVDRLFKRIGLNGRAVIPVVLGFACDTMATLVTRVQESRRERIITTFLLALAVPCSAQYGVIVAVLAGRGAGIAGISIAFLAWAVIVAGVFLLAGLLASRLVPGEAPGFYMELPPMRLPRPTHVLIKTFARMKWYFLEILPIFVFASLLIWVGRLTGLFDLLTGAIVPIVGLLGLPESTSEVFLYGFFRRDFGAAGLFDLSRDGVLNTGQVLVAAVTLTLFMPCVAQVVIMYKERGWKVTGIVIVLVILTAFLVGMMVRGALMLVGGIP